MLNSLTRRNALLISGKLWVPDAKLVETREFDPEERFRERPAEIGGYYDYEGDYFIGVQPHPDWEYNTEYHVWVAPVETSQC